MGERFTPHEIKCLHEGHRLFAPKGGGRSAKGQNWVRLTMERFSFHPSRTEISLRHKWSTMHK